MIVTVSPASNSLPFAVPPFTVTMYFVTVGITSKFAVTDTALEGMVKMVDVLFASAKMTAGLAVQFLNC